MVLRQAYDSYSSVHYIVTNVGTKEISTSSPIFNADGTTSGRVNYQAKEPGNSLHITRYITFFQLP